MMVEMYADVLCPWCYIGKRRLAAALKHIAGRDRVRVVWRSFELAPDASPVPGRSAAEAMADWWGDQAPARVARIRALGVAEGLDLDMHLARPVSTFDAHRLCHLAADRGRADEMMEQLLRAYHTDGLNVADPQVLQRLGGAAGLSGTEIRTVLAGDAYAERVRADRRRATDLGVTSVPSLVINAGFPVPAIQPSADLRRLLESGIRGGVVEGRIGYPPFRPLRNEAISHAVNPAAASRANSSRNAQ
jgi:predicted DsbA family dithiol-disulfide isomerase